MSGVWNRTLVYLGLREEPEEAYSDQPARFVPEDDPHAAHAPPRPKVESPSSDRPGSLTAGRTTHNGAPSGASAAASVPPIAARSVPRPDAPAAERDNVLSLHTGDVHVRSGAEAATARAAVVDVVAFDDVEAVGARYRTGQPVVCDLTEADTATARRVVDFVSGLTYATRGELTKVSGRAFLVVPNGVGLSEDERGRLSELGYRLPTGSDA